MLHIVIIKFYQFTIDLKKLSYCYYFYFYEEDNSNDVN